MVFMADSKLSRSFGVSSAGRGSAGLGAAWLGSAWLGRLSQDKVAARRQKWWRAELMRLGSAWQVRALQGLARQCAATQDKVAIAAAKIGCVGMNVARHSGARIGKTRHGLTTQDKVSSVVRNIAADGLNAASRGWAWPGGAGRSKIR